MTNPVQIPDAAVQALQEIAISKIGLMLTDEHAQLLATAAHLSAPCAVEVKRLEWFDHTGASITKNSIISYGIFEVTKGRNVYTWSLEKDGVFFSKHGTKDEAKAAAQADFERRVRECIVPTPDVKTIIDEIRNGARQGFLNEGDQLEASDADLSCSCCGGSGHKDDVAPIDGAMSPEEHRLENLKQMALYAGHIVSLEFREPYYLASCDTCGWVGSSELCGTDSFGDDSDVYCPRCHSSGADCGKVAECITAKPVDVAAVRRQAFEEAAKLSENDVPVGFKYGSGHGIAAAIRALSAEPAQGENWQSIELVGGKERLIIIGSYNAKGLWCAEVWHTQYLRDQQAKYADGFFMNAPHLEWVPTHFMELPPPPRTRRQENEADESTAE